MDHTMLPLLSSVLAEPALGLSVRSLPVPGPGRGDASGTYAQAPASHPVAPPPVRNGEGTAGVAGLGLVQTILDHVHFGVTVVGPDLELLFANQAAQRECARHPVVRIDRDRLVLLDPYHRGELLRAIAAARSGRWSLVQLGQGGASDDRTMLAVLPLRPGEPTAPALVVFGVRSEGKALAIQFYAQACRLSPAETSVLRSLHDGMLPREIANKHKVALSTVRSQIGSIREKTGTRSITDLIRTLGSLPPITPATVLRA